jgi:hypothetical protein
VISWTRSGYPRDAIVEFTNSQSEASTAVPNSCIYGSCGGIDLIVPSVDDQVAVEIMHELHDALFQLVFRADADLAEERAALAKSPSTRLSQ